MSLVLTLRVGTSTAQDIILTAEPGGVSRYAMGTPDIDQETLRNLGDGDSLSVPAWRNVTESLDLRIIDSTDEAVRTRVQAIERLLDLARQGTTGYLDDRLYLIARFDHDTEDWRSQILAARWLSDTATDQIWRNYVEGTLVLTRRYYWETITQHDVLLTSGVTTTPSSSATVYNADDTHATNRNWLQASADQVIGAIPAPATIALTNASGGDRWMGSLYLGNYVYTAPTTVDPIFRDDQQSVSDSSIATGSESEAAAWLLSSNNLTNSFKGQFGRVLAVFDDRPAVTTLLRVGLQLRMAANIDIVMGEQVLSSANDFVLDLGGIPIPPGGYWDGVGANLHLMIKARAQGSADTLGFNWILVMPSGHGRFRLVQGIETLELAADEAVVDDGANGGVYVLTGANKMPLLRPLFTPIHLWPGKINRIRFLISGGAIAMEPGHIWSASMSYRPRKLTL
jgi:hypothetical protein